MNRSTRDRTILARDGGAPVRTKPLPYRKLFGKEELRMVERVFRESWQKQADFGYQGPFEELYTGKFCGFQGGGYADAVCSGTAALYVALQALDLEPGCDVAVSPVTDPGGVAPVVLLGFKPVIADAAPNGYNMGAAELEAALTPGTRAAVVTHVGGVPADMDPIMKLAASRGIRVIEDCSQAHGALYRGRRVGTFGDIAFFSTMFSKNHATGGCGGVVYARDKALYDRARSIADRGKPFESQGFNPKDPRHFGFPGLNLNQDELSCAIGVSTLAKLPLVIRRRCAIIKGLAKALRSSKAVRPLPFPDRTVPSPFFCTMEVRTDLLSVPKTEFALALSAEGAWVNEEYRYVSSEWEWLGPHLAQGADTPNATDFRDRSFNILFNERFTDKDVRDIAAATLKVEKAFLK